MIGKGGVCNHRTRPPCVDFENAGDECVWRTGLATSVLMHDISLLSLRIHMNTRHMIHCCTSRNSVAAYALQVLTRSRVLTWNTQCLLQQYELVCSMCCDLGVLGARKVIMYTI